MFCVVSRYVKSSLTVVVELESKSSFVLRVLSCHFGNCCCSETLSLAVVRVFLNIIAETFIV